MRVKPNEFSPMRTARYAGLLYLIIIVLGVWSEGFVRSAMVVSGDPAATVANIVAGEGLFRLSLTAATIMALCDVALAVLLFVLLRPVSPVLALMALVFRLCQAAVIGANLVNQQAALLAIQMPGDMGPALALHHLQMQSHGYDLALIFFGVNSLLVGWLIWHAGFLPRILGLLVAAAGLVYLTGSYIRILAPDGSETFAMAYAVPLLAETALCLWLLVRGVDQARWLRARGQMAPF